MDRRQVLKRAALCTGVAAVPPLAVAALWCQPSTFATEQVAGVALSPDGKALAVANTSNDTVCLWNLAWRGSATTIPVPRDSTDVLAFSPDGKTLAGGGKDQAVHVWDLATQAEQAALRGQGSKVCSVAFSPDGTCLASGGANGSLQFWDVANGTGRAAIREHASAVHQLAFSPDGRFLASGGYHDAILLWDVSTGRLRTTLHGQFMAVLGLAFSPDGTTLASAGMDCRVFLHDLVAGTRRTLQSPKWLLNGSADYTEYVAFSPDGKYLASGTDAVVGLWDVASGKPLASFGWGYRPLGPTILDVFESSMLGTDRQARIDEVLFTPGGTLLALGKVGRSVKVWRLAKVPT